MMMCDNRAGSLVTGTRATLQLSQHERNASTQRDAVDLADFLGLHIESSRRDERSARHRWAHASQTWSGDKAWAWNDGWWWVMMRRKGISWLLTIEMSFAWLIHSFLALLWEVAPPAWGDRVHQREKTLISLFLGPRLYHEGWASPCVQLTPV